MGTTSPEVSSYSARISAFAYALLRLLLRVHASPFPVTNKYFRTGDTKRLRTYKAEGFRVRRDRDVSGFWFG
jgi:hypothetical protein